MGRLEGRVAVVTGAARGQGRAHALALAAEGAAVVACDIAGPIASVPYPLATPEDLAETVRQVEEADGLIESVVTDIRSTAQVESMVERTIERFGRLDILVANAGVCGYSSFGDLGDDQWNDMIDTNLTGTFKCMRGVLPQMTEQGYGRVVVTSSGAGRTGSPNLAHYCASKWAVIGLVKTFALETARLGITANVICPSTVNTPMVTNEQNYRLFCPDIKEPTLADALPRLSTLNPMRLPWLEPEQVAETMIYLVTDPGVLSGGVIEVSMGAAAYRV
jgi:SDR family mycofactocin-dependent oxidoreductase